MAPHPTILLGLVLCMGQMTHAQNGLHPRPSIRAEPGPVVSRGQPVTILCKGPAWADSFRLEKEKNIHAYVDQKVMPQSGSLETEVRFLIPSVSEATAGPYHCAYVKTSSWCERSEVLELVLTDEDVSVLPSGTSSVLTSPPTEASSQTALAFWNYTVGSCIHISQAGVVLLILVAIVAEGGHNQCHSPHGTQEGVPQRH